MKKIIKGVLIITLLLMFVPVQAKENKQKYKNYAHDLVINKYHWTEKDYSNLVKLWNKESGWRVKAKNGKYYGIPQTSKKKYGKKYNDYKTQIKVGLKYIKRRYGNPTKAWKHFKKKHWY
jgi:hypothetical protein